jgi:hypothetical protein
MRMDMHSFKNLRSIVAVLVAVLIIGTLSSTTLTAENYGTFYRVKIHEEVLTKPHALTAWKYYGASKEEWRKELFFKQFPNEKKYFPSYKEELNCRRQLAQYWINQKKNNSNVTDRYLDDLVRAYNSMYFPEYVYKYFKKSSWKVKKNRFRLKEFKKWAKQNIKGHRAKTLAHLEETDL